MISLIIAAIKIQDNMSAILAAILDFLEIVFLAKLQGIFVNLVENMCLQPQIGI